MCANGFDALIGELITQEDLPATYRTIVRQSLMPLAERVAARRHAAKRPFIVGVHGAQGTGKTTLARFLSAILDHCHGYRTVSLSLDDFYLTRSERAALARDVHPLLMTRGVPGTHDLDLAAATVEQLLAATPRTHTRIPVFDKSIDDRLPAAEWRMFRGRPEVILFEGWCVGARPESDPDALRTPINALEREQDADARWRTYVNECLKGPYARFFQRLDCLIMLRAPSMEAVLDWRRLQERKLADRLARTGGSGAAMSDSEVARFVMYYERITRACLAEMPHRADAVIDVARDHVLGAPVFR